MLDLVMRDYGFRYQLCWNRRVLFSFYVPTRWLRDRLARYWRRHYGRE